MSPLRILIVDDTITYKMILREVLKNIPDTDVQGTASNGQEALRFLEAKTVDIVLLDVEMPVMDGLSALKIIRQKHPHTSVIMVSGANKNSANITIQCLEAGAIDFVSKPEGDELQSSKNQLKETLTPIFKLVADKKDHQRTAAPTKRLQPIYPVAPPSNDLLSIGKFEALVIGISTGGPKALMDMVPKLPRNIGIPMFLVIHMPPFFTASLADRLNQDSSLKVVEGQAGMKAKPNTLYIAPGGLHMGIERLGDQIQIITDVQTGPIKSCRPAVDYLFKSAADVYGKKALSIIMTGMGDDGTDGVKEIKKQGGYCLTQTADSCVVYGMPRSVDELGLSDEQVDLTQLPYRIKQILEKSGGRQLV